MSEEPEEGAGYPLPPLDGQTADEIKTVWLRSLLAGLPKTGKTRAGGTLAERWKTCVLMFDQAGEETFLAFPRAVRKNLHIFRPGNYTDTMRMLRWLAAGEHDFEALLVDSLTTLYDPIMASVLSLPIKGEGSATQTYTDETETADRRRIWPILADWGLAGERMRQLVLNCTRLQMHFAATTHVDLDRDEVLGEIVAAPALPGKLAGRIPLFFSQYVQCTSKEVPGGVVYELITKPSGRFQAGVRDTGVGLPKEVEPNLPQLLDLIMAGVNREERD